MLDQEYAFFDQNRESFVREHADEYVVIQESTVKGFFKTEREALLYMKDQELGSFIIQKCVSVSDETARYVSRIVAFA